MNWTTSRTAALILGSAIPALALTPATATAQQAAKATAAQDSPARGYLKAHRDLQDPRPLSGGPITTKITQDSGGVYVALPSPRPLDETVFGTPESPSATGGYPVVEGLPVDMRETQGDKFTQTAKPTPFGDKHIEMSGASLDLTATDATATDAATSDDRVEMTASWQDEQGNTYSVTCCDKLETVGGQHPTFGGVVTDHLLHGFTRVGTPLFPTLFASVGFWGSGEIKKNGEVIDGPRPIHGMLTEYARTEDYKLVKDENVDPARRYFHIMVAPVVPGDDGGLKDKPVNTGFTPPEAPEGKELPFWHVMFEDLTVTAERGDG